MATEIVWTCSADGLEDDGVTATDYSDPQLWDDTEAKDLVAADQIGVLEFFSHASGVFSGTGNLLTINAGWTTDATRFIWLRFRAGQGHGGTLPANYLYTITNNGIMVETEGSGIFCLVEGLTFRMNGSGVNFSFMVNATNASNCWADACLAVVDNHSTGTGSEMFNGGGGSGSRLTRFFVRNCISIDNNGNLNKHVSLIDPSAGFGKREIYNNTFIGGVNGIHDDGFTLNAEVIIKNNIVQGCSTADYEITGTPVTAANISSDATSPQSALRNISLTFDDAANDNYHLASGDTDAIDAGEDLTTEFQAYPHGTSVDIDGDPRPTGAGTWDIGADEIVSAASGVDVDVPAAGAAVASVAPSVAAGASIAVPAADVAVTALAPSVSTGALVAIPAASIVVAGLVPSIATGAAVSVPASDIPVAALAPDIRTGVAVPVPAAGVEIVVLAPSLATGVAVGIPAAGMVVSGLAPEVSAATGTVILVPVADIAIAGLAPSVAAGVAVAVPASGTAVAGLAPSIALGALVDVPTAGVGVEALAPSVSAGIAINVPAAGVTAAALAPTVSASDGASVAVPSALIEVIANSPIVVASAGLDTTTPGGQIALEVQQALMEAGEATSGAQGDDIARQVRDALREAGEALN